MIFNGKNAKNVYRRRLVVLSIYFTPPTTIFAHHQPRSLYNKVQKMKIKVVYFTLFFMIFYFYYISRLRNIEKICICFRCKSKRSSSRILEDGYVFTPRDYDSRWRRRFTFIPIIRRTRYPPRSLFVVEQKSCQLGRGIPW